MRSKLRGSWSRGLGSNQRRCFHSLRRRVCNVYQKITRLQGTPPEIARGVAAGIFAGMMPLFGVQTIFAVSLAVVIRGNPFAAAISTWISNPLTFIPLYMLNFKVGQCLLSNHDLIMTLKPGMSIGELLQLGFDCLITLTVGCVALGLPLSFITYFLVVRLVRRRQHHTLSD